VEGTMEVAQVQRLTATGLRQPVKEIPSREGQGVG
jgi:hypothetical protein